MVSEAILELTEQDFEKNALKSKVPVLVDFWAEWCGPCKALLPVLKELAGEGAGRFKIAKVNVDDHPSIANTFGIMNIPTMILLKEGREVDRLIGYMSKNKISEKINAIL